MCMKKLKVDSVWGITEIHFRVHYFLSPVRKCNNLKYAQLKFHLFCYLFFHLGSNTWIGYVWQQSVEGNTWTYETGSNKRVGGVWLFFKFDLKWICLDIICQNSVCSSQRVKRNIAFTGVCIYIFYYKLCVFHCFRNQVCKEHLEHYVLVVDGQSLHFILTASEEHLEAFQNVCRACTSVICCRMTPLQKCQVCGNVTHL